MHENVLIFLLSFQAAILYLPIQRLMPHRGTNPQPYLLSSPFPFTFTLMIDSLGSELSACPPPCVLVNDSINPPAL